MIFSAVTIQFVNAFCKDEAERAMVPKNQIMNVCYMILKFRRVMWLYTTYKTARNIKDKERMKIICCEL